MSSGAQTTPPWSEQEPASEPGLLDLDWDALLPPEPPGVAIGPELPDPLALFEALRQDDRPPLSGPVDRVVEEITHRIVAAWNPRRIVLFGSRARGEATGRSDIDLLVELDSYTTAQRATLGLYRSIGRSEPGVDVVVARPEVLAAQGGQPGSLYERALREGRVLYERRSGAPAAPPARV